MQRVRGFLLAAFVVAFAAQASAQVALPGTDWVGSVQLKAKISVPGQGSDKVAGPVTLSLYFGPLPGQGLAANQFLLEIDDGATTLEIEGSYATDARGNPLLAPNNQAFALELRELIDDVCVAQLGSQTQCDAFALSVPLTQLALKARTSKAGVQSIKSAGKIVFQLQDGAATKVRVKLSFKSASGGLQ